MKILKRKFSKLQTGLCQLEEGGCGSSSEPRKEPNEPYVRRLVKDPDMVPYPSMEGLRMVDCDPIVDHVDLVYGEIEKLLPIIEELVENKDIFSAIPLASVTRDKNKAEFAELCGKFETQIGNISALLSRDKIKKSGYTLANENPLQELYLNLKKLRSQKGLSEEKMDEAERKLMTECSKKISNLNEGSKVDWNKMDESLEISK